MGADWKRKKVTGRARQLDRKGGGYVYNFPLENFAKSWCAMGGGISNFYDANMFDFESLRNGWLAAQGLNEDGEKDEPDKMTAEDLDQLYKDMGFKK